MFDSKTSKGALILGLVIFLLGSLLLLIVFGVVEGEEFSPQTFTYRSFRYHVVPLLGTMKFKTIKTPLGSYVQSNGLIGSVASEPARWDIVNIANTEGDADILASYLRQSEADGDLWVAWSRDHAALAKELWPLVARLAHEDLYILIPDILDAAAASEAKNTFGNELQQVLAAELEQLSQARQDIGEADRANQLRRLRAEVCPDVRAAFTQLAEP